jgi:2-desacetyl-2-hydroxyethyl bacteriochlorophyllide A dehydrogenase
MKAVLKSHSGHGVELTEVPLPQLKQDEVLVKVEAASICGSDLHMYHGMEAYQWVPLPLVLGHEFAGSVVDSGSQHNQHLIGKRVMINPYVPCGNCFQCRKGKTNLCDYGLNSMSKVAAKSLKYGFRENGGMAEYVAVNQRNVLPIPDELSFEVASIVEAVGIGVHAIEQANVLPGDRVVVIGPGPIGLSLIASLSNYALKHLIVVGLRVDRERLQLAQRLGATDIIYADEENDIEAVARLTHGEGVDFVFETSGYHQSLVTAIRMCTKGGKVMLVGISGKETMLPSNEIVRGEITLKGVYGVTEDTLRRTIAMASSGRFPFAQLITHILPLEQAVQGFEIGSNKQGVKVVLKP